MRHGMSTRKGGFESSWFVAPHTALQASPGQPRLSHGTTTPCHTMPPLEHLHPVGGYSQHEKDLWSEDSLSEYDLWLEGLQRVLSVQNRKTREPSIKDRILSSLSNVLNSDVSRPDFAQVFVLMLIFTFLYPFAGRIFQDAYETVRYDESEKDQTFLIKVKPTCIPQTAKEPVKESASGPLRLLLKSLQDFGVWLESISIWETGLTSEPQASRRPLPPWIRPRVQHRYSHKIP